MKNNIPPDDSELKRLIWEEWEGEIKEEDPRQMVFKYMKWIRDNYCAKQPNSGCPCLYLETPCTPGCTCKNSFSSVGCKNCCRYGSVEQKTNKAKYLTTKFEIPTVDQLKQLLYDVSTKTMTDKGVEMVVVFEDQAKAIVELLSKNSFLSHLPKK